MADGHHRVINPEGDAASAAHLTLSNLTRHNNEEIGEEIPFTQENPMLNSRSASGTPKSSLKKTSFRSPATPRSEKISVRSFKMNMKKQDSVLDDSEAASLQDGLTSESDLNSEADAELTRKDLEDLQIQTIYSLVEPVPVEVNGNTTMAKMLFLTSHQCLQLDLNNLPKFTQAMDINPTPKLVINLLASSAHYWTNMACSQGSHWTKRASRVIEGDVMSGYDYAELGGERGLSQTDCKLAMFLRETVLPVAVQTNALVLAIDDGCSMAKAWGDLVADETAKRGGKVPFTTINIGCAADYDAQSIVNGTIAHQLRMGSKRWRHNQRRVINVMETSSSKWRVNWLQHDGPPAGCSHYIIADGVNDKKKKVDYSATRTLAKNLTTAFAKVLPSIGLVSLNHSDTFANGVLNLSNYVGRGLPLLLLDSRDRPMVNNLQEAEQHLKEVEAVLNKVGLLDYYKDSTFSFMHTVLKRINERKKKSEGQGMQGKTEGVEIYKILEDHAAKERAETNKLTHVVSANSKDSEDNIIQRAVEVIKRLEYAKQTNDERIRTAAEVSLLNSLPEPSSYDEIDAILLSECQRWSTVKGQLEERFSALTDLPIRFKSKGLWKPRPDKKVKVPWCEVFVCNREESAFEDVKATWVGLVESFKKDKQSKYKADSFRANIHMGLTELLRSPNTHSCNLTDLETIKATIKRVAKTDRFPQKNTFEGFQILQSTWDKIDVFNEQAVRQKRNAKRAYILLLLLGAAVTIITVVSINFEGFHCHDNPITVDWTQYTDSIIITLTLSASITAALVAYANPGTKWQQLRGASLALESEVWKFRTRTGDYGTKKEDSGVGMRDAELKLQNYSEVIKQHVVKSATVMNTSFLARFDGLIPNSKSSLAAKDTMSVDVESGASVQDNTSKNRIDISRKLKATRYRHGQHPDAGILGTFGAANRRRQQGNLLMDDHHSPITPDQYLRIRVAPQLAFYQRRLPTYSRMRFSFEAILVLGSISGTVLAFMDQSNWAAVPTALTAAFAAYSEFHGTEKKLLRYSDSIANLDSILMWWRTLTDVEKASIDNKNKLVTCCEQIFQSERQAWVSTSMNNKMLMAESSSQRVEASEYGGNGGGD